MRQWNKETIEEQLKLHKKQNKDDRYNYMSEQFNALWYCWELEKYTLEKDKEIKRLNKKYEDAVADYEEQKYIINELEEHLVAMSKIYEEEYKDIDASAHYKSILDKLKALKEGK